MVLPDHKVAITDSRKNVKLIQKLLPQSKSVTRATAKDNSSPPLQSANSVILSFEENFSFLHWPRAHHVTCK